MHLDSPLLECWHFSHQIICVSFLELKSVGEVPREDLVGEGLPCIPCDSGQYLFAGWESANSSMHSL